MQAPIGIGAAIRKFREAGGLTQDELAERLSPLFGGKPLSRAVISQWESERILPGDQKLSVLEKFMDLESGTLILAKFMHGLRVQGIKVPKLQFDEDEQQLLTMWRSGNLIGMLDFIQQRLRDQAVATSKQPRKPNAKKR